MKLHNAMNVISQPTYYCMVHDRRVNVLGSSAGNSAHQHYSRNVLKATFLRQFTTPLTDVPPTLVSILSAGNNRGIDVSAGSPDTAINTPVPNGLETTSYEHGLEYFNPSRYSYGPTV